MKKRLVGLLMTVAMTASLITVPVTQAADASPFTDVPTDHWAYSNIVELANAGVVSGMGDGTFEPESELTRAEMTKLLVCVTDVYDETRAYNATFFDVSEDEWYAGYIASGIAAGMYGSEYEGLFSPDSALSRGECVEWIINVLGADSSREYSYADISDADVAAAASDATAIGIINGYEDGTFRPDSSLTRAEATAIIKRIMDYIAERDDVRADAANEIVLNDDVIIIESDSDTNIPVAADEEKCTVSFKNADSSLKALKTGDILYMPPSVTLPDGLVGKITTVENGTYTTIGLEQASIEEVIKSIDISAYFGVNESMVEDDGDLELISASNTSSAGYSSAARSWSASGSALSTVGSAAASTDSDSDTDSGVSAVESGDNGADFDVDADAGISEISLWNKTIGVYGNANATSKLHYETPSYSDKKSIYAAIDMTLETLVDMKVEVSDGKLSVFDVSTGINTDVATTAGYHNSGSKDFSYSLPTIDIPIAGLVKVEIKPKLTASASGELTVETSAALSNKIGLTYTLADGFDAYNTTTADASLSVSAEGELKAGPEIDAALKLCEVKIPVLDVTIMDGFDVADVSVAIGAGANGKLDEELTVSISDTEANISTGSEDELHPCYFCVEGEIFWYYSGEIGLGEDIQNIYKEITDKSKELKKTIEDEQTLSPWHLSSGEGYTLEFELEECPHVLYKTAVKLVKKDAVPTEYVTGANVTITGDETKTLKEDDGSYLIYAAEGLYTVNAECDGYKDADRKAYVYKANEYILEMEEELDYVKIYTEFFNKTKFSGKKITYYDLYNWKIGTDTCKTSSVRDAYIFDCDNDGIPELVVSARSSSYPSVVYLIYRYNIDNEQVENVYNLFGSGGGSGSSYFITFMQRYDGLVYLKYEERYHTSVAYMAQTGYSEVGGTNYILIMENDVPVLLSGYDYGYKYSDSTIFDCVINDVPSDYYEYYNSFYSGYTEYEFTESGGGNDLTKYYSEDE